MRVTNKMFTDSALINIQQQRARLLEAQQAVASGKRVRTPSDDPISTRRILDLRRTLDAFAQFKTNRGITTSLLQATDSALGDVSNALVRAKELALAGSSSTAGTSDRTFILKEVEQLFQHAIEMGNTDIGGRFIFAGQASDTPPFTRLVTTASTASGLTPSGTISTMSADDVLINGATIRVPTAADDTVSTSDNTASALALSAAINDATATTGVRAEASTTLSLSVASFGNLAGTDFQINGVAVTGSMTDAAALVAAINAANIPEIMAFSTSANNLTLQAADGRNIQLQTTGLSTGGMSFSSFDLGGGLALDQTTTGSVRLISDSAFTISGANPASAGFSAQTVDVVTGQYTGGSGQIELQMAAGQRLAVNVLGSRFLAADLRPDLDLNTPVSRLRQAQGISTGSIQVADRAGNTAIIDLSAARTVGDIINTISAASGVNVTASINTAGNGVTIRDDNAVATRNLTITEVGGGTTAAELGVLADRSGDIVGAPLHAALSETTPLALLHEGRGVIPGTVHITNGAMAADVDLSTAQSIHDVLSLINASGLKVTASINVAGTAIDVRSNDPTTVAIVTESGNGTTAADLGLQGAHDILKTLSLLQEALQQNDVEALNQILRHIDAGLDQILAIRGDVGARMNRVELADTRSADLELTVEEMLSQSEDADVFAAASRLTRFSSALQASLAAAAHTVQLSLLDFLR